MPSIRLYSDENRNPDLRPFSEWFRVINEQADILARQAVEQNIDLYDAERYVTRVVETAFSIEMLKLGMSMLRRKRDGEGR